MTVVLASLAAAMIAAPHVLRLEGVHAGSAATIWFFAVCVRALVAIYATLFVVLYVPATAVFQVVTHWCWHTAVPLLTTHLGLSGHSVGDLALLAPVIGLTASLASVSFGLWRAARLVGAWVRRTSIGPGPGSSVIVGEFDVVVAAAGLRRPRVVVSAGALTALDDEELAASLAHEHGHIARRHRFVLLCAEVCRAVARWLPGTRTAVDELIFHLERDADRWAIARSHDPCALATAICKAAQREPHHTAALLTLGGGGVPRRVLQLVRSGDVVSRRQVRLNALIGTMAAVIVALAFALPATASTGLDRPAAPKLNHHCPV